MSSSSERPPRTLGDNPPGASEDATVPPPDPALNTAAYIPQTEPSNKLPTQLPATFGRYQLQKLLGQGGMGAVYLAHDTQLDRLVALKIPIFCAEEGSQVLARFYREARAAATILHANICPVFDVGEVDGVPYLTMAYIEGKSLAEWIQGRRLTGRQSAFLVRKLALALQEAHKKGVIHRDLKPANIMIDPRGEPVIMDFGLARRNRPGDARLTQKGTVMGTPAYMPPEQVSGKPEAMGPASDIYSLGVILYELVAGRLPFSGDPMAMLSQVLLDEPPSPSQFRADLDPGLERICLKAMAKKSEDRYDSMMELAAALQGFLRSESTPASTVQPISRSADSAVEVGADWHTVVQSAADPAQIITAQRKLARRVPKRGRSLWLWLVGGAAGVLLLSCLGVVWLVISLWPQRSDSPPPKTMPPIRPEGGFFVPLFNGKDLSDWERPSGDPTAWHVASGTMGFTLTNPSRQRGWLVTRNDYTDFHLRLEFQIVKPGSQSSVGLRMWPGAPKPLKIPIQDDTFPAFAALPPTERLGSLHGITVFRGFEGRNPGMHSLGEWNQMEIELRGWSLSVAVNHEGTVMTRLNDDSVFRYLDGAPPASGRIGLQHAEGSIRFRRLEIRDLSGLEDASAKR